MEYTRKITLDVNAEDNFKIVPMKQGDALQRKLEITLTSDGAEFTPTGVSEAMLRIQKPDGKAVVQSTKDDTPITVSGATYTVPLISQALVADGRAYCDFTLLDEDGGTLSSCTFIMLIIPAPNVASRIESTDVWERLLKAIEDAEAAAGKLDLRLSDDKVYIQLSTDGGKTWRNVILVSDIIPVESVNGKTGVVELTAEDIDNGDNTVAEDITSLKEDLSGITTATDEDVDKALKVKTVADGKVTEWEFGDVGGTSDEITHDSSAETHTAGSVGEALESLKEDLSGLQATALYVDTEGFICLKESD